MQLPHLCTIVAALLLQSALGQTLLDRVIGLLKDLEATSVAEYNTEEAATLEHNTWCTDKKADANTAVRTVEGDILNAEAAVEEHTGTINEQAIFLKQLTANIANIEKDLEDAAYDIQRAEECTTATATYDTAIAALGGAIEKITSQQVFLQTNATQLNNASLRAQLSATVKKYSSLLGNDLSTVEDPEFEKAGWDELYATMQRIKGLVEEQKDAHTGQCTALQRSGDDRTRVLTGDLSTANTNKGVAEGLLTTAYAERNSSQESYVNGKALLETYEGALSALEATCDTESNRLAEQLKTRQGEINVLRTAIELLEGEVLNSIDGKYNNYTISTTVADASGGGLASLRAFLVHDGDGQRRANEFLLEQAHKLNSSLLMNFASSIGRSDPFGKVKTMIETLLARLRKEAAEEMSHSELCEKNLQKATDDLEKEKAEQQKLLTRRDLLDAQSDELETQIADGNTTLAELERTMEEAAERRANETEAFKETVEDAEQAKSVLEKALGMLKGIFERGAALVQKEEPSAGGEEDLTTTTTMPAWMGAPPSSNVSEYHGMEEDNDVVALLETVYQDFVTLEEEARATEAELSKAYEEEAAASKAATTALVKDQHSKRLQKNDIDNKFGAVERKLTTANSAVGAAQEVLNATQGDCTDAGSTKEARNERITSEINALIRACQMLSDEEDQEAQDACGVIIDL